VAFGRVKPYVPKSFRLGEAAQAMARSTLRVFYLPVHADTDT
jgi:hypothetical protein